MFKLMLCEALAVCVSAQEQHFKRIKIMKAAIINFMLTPNFHLQNNFKCDKSNTPFDQSAKTKVSSFFLS